MAIPIMILSVAARAAFSTAAGIGRVSASALRAAGTGSRQAAVLTGRAAARGAKGARQMSAKAASRGSKAAMTAWRVKGLPADALREIVIEWQNDRDFDPRRQAEILQAIENDLREQWVSRRHDATLAARLAMQQAAIRMRNEFELTPQNVNAIIREEIARVQAILDSPHAAHLTTGV